VNKEDFEGKKVGELLEDDTEFPEYNENGPPPELVDMVVKYPRIRTVDNISVLTDYNDNVFVFADGKLKAVFGIYELHGIAINPKRNLVIAYGHEDINMYWLDDGEYVNIATR
jgi:hypothetical protein